MLQRGVDNMKLLFFDTETTDIRPGNICQLSYILVDTSTKPHTISGTNMFFTVEYVEPSAEKVHGFSVEKLYELSEGRYFEDCYEEFINDFQTADVIIGHNVNFDVKFLSYELDGCGEEFNPKHIFCTMNYFKNICKLPGYNGDYKCPKLQEAVDFLGISSEKISKTSDEYFGDCNNYHDARYDTTATYLVVIEGIRKGYIPSHYFTKMVADK